MKHKGFSAIVTWRELHWLETAFNYLRSLTQLLLSFPFSPCLFFFSPLSDTSVLIRKGRKVTTLLRQIDATFWSRLASPPRCVFSVKEESKSTAKLSTKLSIGHWSANSSLGGFSLSVSLSFLTNWAYSTQLLHGRSPQADHSQIWREGAVMRTSSLNGVNSVQEDTLETKAEQTLTQALAVWDAWPLPLTVAVSSRKSKERPADHTSEAYTKSHITHTNSKHGLLRYVTVFAILCTPDKTLWKYLDLCLECTTSSLTWKRFIWHMTWVF